ncbi:MAG: Type IV secretion system protein VirB11 [Legionellaceae bacterium]
MAKLLANSTKQIINSEKPLLSAQLKQGERVQIVIPPAVPEGTTSITIRKPSNVLLTLDYLEEQGVFNDVIFNKDKNLYHEEIYLLELLKAKCIKKFIIEAIKTRKNIIISGETGAGKTTFSKAMIQWIPKNERLITIEDVPELTLPNHPNHVRLIYSKDGQGLSKVTPKQLLEACLRMKPDRILLSELRSTEAYYYLRNINSGHPGSITTIHAGSPRLAFEQLMLLIKESSGGNQLSRHDIKSLLYLLIDIIIQFKYIAGRGRVMTEIYYEPTVKK